MPKTNTDNVILFEKNIRAILKNINPSKCLSNSSKKQLNMLVIILVEIITKISNICVINSKKKTIRADEIKNAIKIISTYNLYIESGKYIEEHMNAFQNFVKSNTSYVSRNKKANLLLSIPSIEKIIRQNTSFHITKNTSLFLTSYIEYIIFCVLESTSYSINTNRINIKDIQKSIDEDEDLKKLFISNKIQLLGGGFKPYIIESLFTIKDSNDKQLIRMKEKTNTKIKKNIIKLQNESHKLTLSKNQFSTIIRSLIRKINPSMKLSKKIYDIIQFYIEQKIIEIIKKANYICIHSGRSKLKSNDLLMVLFIMDKYKNPYLKQPENISINTLTSNFIQLKNLMV